MQSIGSRPRTGVLLGIWVATFFLGCTQSSQFQSNPSSRNSTPSVGSPSATPPPWVQRPWPDTTSGIHVFHDQIDISDDTSAQIQFAATHYAGTQKLLLSEAQTIRSYNPQFLILHYRVGFGLGYQSITSGTCSPSAKHIQIIDGNSWVQEWPGNSVVQSQWFYVYNGNLVLNCSWGWYLMDVSNPSYQNWWLGQVSQQLTTNTDDGIFMDSFSVPNYLGATDFQPNLPAIDAAFESTWSTNMHNWLVWLKANLPRYYLVPNVGSWINSRDQTNYSPADGMMVEGFATGGDGSPYAVGDWQLEMNRILGAVANNQAVIGQTYVTGVRGRMFTIGSYLLVKGSRTYVAINNYQNVEWYPEYDMPIGAPTQSAGNSIINLLNSSTNLYRRNFTNGFVLVNPGSTSITASLGGTYYLTQISAGGLINSDGTSTGALTYSAVSSVTLPAVSAAVLFNSLP